MASPLADYSGLIKKRLRDQERVARKLIAHSGEKGRAVEAAISTVLRGILPAKFELGTGFIINSKGGISPQLDIVIYDRFNNAPIEMEGGVGIFPVECVYGFVEVKTTLRARDVVDFAKAVSQIRKLAKAKEYATLVSNEVLESEHRTAGTIVSAVAKRSELAPRSYLFAHKVYTHEYETLIQKITGAFKTYNAHAHAICVLSENWFLTQRPFMKEPAFKRKSGDAFINFHLSLLGTVQSFPMAPMYLRPYIKAAMDK